MKKTLLLIVSMLLCVVSYAQVDIMGLTRPNMDGISYQAVVRDANSNIVADKTLDIEITLTAESALGKTVAQYSEKQTVTTNVNGLVSLVIGKGESEQKYTDFDWSIAGATYRITTSTEYGTGTTQLLSVPFAMYAVKAGSIDYAALLQSLSESDLATILGLADYLKKQDISSELAGYAKSSDLAGLAKSTDLADYAKAADLAGLAKSTDLADYAKAADLAGLAKSTDLAGLAKSSDLADNLQESKDYTDAKLADYATNENLGAYVTDEELSESLESYATITRLMSEVSALQDALAELQSKVSGYSADKVGDLPMCKVNIKITDNSKATDPTNTTTFSASVFGKTLADGDVLTIPAGTPLMLTAALSQYLESKANCSNREYTYQVKINGEFFNNKIVTREVGENVYNSFETADVSYYPITTASNSSSQYLYDESLGAESGDPSYYYVDLVDRLSGGTQIRNGWRIKVNENKLYINSSFGLSHTNTNSTIYAKIPNYIYKNVITDVVSAKVGTLTGDRINGSMVNEHVLTVTEPENTIEIIIVDPGNWVGIVN